MTRGITSKRRQNGSILFSSLALLVVLAIGLGALISGSQQELRANERMLSWKQALPVAEAGIEEALAHLNASGFQEANGWFINPTNGCLQKQRTMDTGYFTAQITSNAIPVIRSTGYVQAPLKSTLLARTIEATVRIVKMSGIEATNTIDGSSDGVLDSYDSSDPNGSTSKQYDPAKARDNCRLATISPVNNKISLGSRKVWGYVSTAGGTAAVGSKGKVGSKAWVARSDTAGKIEPGHFSTPYVADFPPNVVPFLGGLAPLQDVIISGTKYKYVFGNGDYQMGKLTLNSSDQAIVTGKARLLVTSQFSLTASSSLEIAPGGSIEIYVACSTLNVTGRGFLNSNATARELKIFGLPANTAINLQGTADFVGIINAPSANVKLAGGSTYFGHVKAGSADISGGNAFHADEAVGSPSYLIASWTEL